MHPRYPRSFFALQLAFAQRVAARFRLPFAEAILRYTPVAVSLHIEDDWGAYAAALAQSADPLELTYQIYLERRGDEPAPQPGDTSYGEYPLFGCFYYAVRDETTIRPHFINNDHPGVRPLGRERADARRDDLRRMFAHIRAAVPAATTVMGNSWLYNLAAYTRLFPPSYTQRTEENPDGVLDQVVLWFQCYDRFWEAKPSIADELLRRVEGASDLAELRFCFPYQRLRVRAPIADFYSFYGVTGV
jgi:hypothetical protein